MARQEDKKQHIQVKRRVSHQIEVKIFSPWGQSAFGTGCPETLSSHHLGRFLRHRCVTCWETQADFTADPALSRRLGWRSPEGPSNLSHHVILLLLPTAAVIPYENEKWQEKAVRSWRDETETSESRKQVHSYSRGSITISCAPQQQLSYATG